ncbi:P-loop containing nucleoside triphosphate hydrolase protein [Aspergillus pseudonomiae]|uniref:P-loop containing nucleoside triphosphate hydrolase protein n=1 Tax=Aspergillus pseudonomiae TaxID=1506151 RepID=A0A5N6IHW9_9EURO|nr:P-loop containing nucleoside triphosphate hydrolase protein [Aspergillus pseudonomiae]KAB8265747.1 P-loop containing nucleoside triphosphate hydrolase protein [Aspergillus pseudonomiae]KAE8405794.1 P-loop containing nucleoside triphosphate hydrolase protein [Aspergillus pseudonomiae]
MFMPYHEDPDSGDSESEMPFSEDEAAYERGTLMTSGQLAFKNTRKRETNPHQGQNSQRVKYAPAGSICEARNEYPDDLTVPVENTESGQYAMISDLLKKFLNKLLKGYPGLTMALKRVEIQTPFMRFIHRWEAFSKAREDIEDSATRSVVDLLYRVLEEELGEIITHKKDLIHNCVITHVFLWAIFEPGAHLYSVDDDHERVFELLSITLSSDGVFGVSSMYIDYDGTSFGYRMHDEHICLFEGTQPIIALPIFPLKFHPKAGAVQENLIAPGKLWEKYSGYHCKQYEGPGFAKFMGRHIQISVKSRIIIDGEAFNTFNPNHSIKVDPCLKPLNDEKRLLATPMQRGYSLKDKKWLEVPLEGVRDIVWDSQAFDSLVLPAEQQRLHCLILAIAKAQSKQMDTFDDVVQGKGRGVILQLSGPPGVGKTLTAESVAEAMRVPLYVLSAGDLGTSAGNVEKALKDILRMVPKWGAVLLLDEADMLMETRNARDLVRNELGILFLTTNRAESIDPAFESRIHMSARYPALDVNSRRQIWAQFLGGSMGFSSEQLDSLAQVKLNGRQIKNVVKTAHLLAREQDLDIEYDHVRAVLDLRAANLMDVAR